MKKFIQNQSSIKPKISNHLMIGCSAIIGIFFLDQVTKFIAVSLLPFGQVIEIIPILSFILVYNTGVSFSLFSGASIFILIPVSLTVIFIVAWMWLKTSNSQSAAFGYGMIIGGAFGNLVDRIYRDGVVDFILFHIGSWSFAVFNIADSAISIGVVLLLFDTFRSQNDKI